jgi:drug/metabolite transporter (DMT)-like permease
VRNSQGLASPIHGAYLTVILIWSTTPLAIKWSAVGGGYAFAVLARMLIGVLLAAALLKVWRVGLPLHARARRSYLAGGLGIFGAMFCTYWGAQYIDSGLVAVLFGLAPLVTSLLAAWWLDETTLRPARVAGLLLGLAGLAVIFATGAPAGGASAVAGMLALLAAVLIYSASLVWLKRIGDDSPPLATTTGSLLVSLPLFALAWAMAGGQVPEALPLRAGAAIVYLAVFGSVLGFALYYHVVRHLEAARVALITLVTPVLALLLGHAANGEAVGLRVWLGAGLISLGLVLHQRETPGRCSPLVAGTGGEHEEGGA